MDQQTKDPDVLNVLVLERVDRTKNMARYYVLSVEPTLFAESSLVRCWGRIGGVGRTRIDLHASPPLGELIDIAGGFHNAREFLDHAALDRKSTRLNSSHVSQSRMPSSA